MFHWQSKYLYMKSNYDRNTACLSDTVRQDEVSGRKSDRRSGPAADFPRDVCLTVSRNNTVFLTSSTNI